MTPTIQPPPAERFAAHPSSWYLFGASRDLDAGPRTRRMLGRDLVAFRTASGRVAVMDAHCSHLGADLGRGHVEGESIRCPFHHWRYGVDGRCVEIPNGCPVPAAARQRTYPAEERHGYLFVFNGREAMFPLPFFFDADPADFAAGPLFSYVADCTWYMNAAHAFDTQHFAAVHDRELVAPPEVDCPAPFARRNRYRAKVIGKSRLDGMLRTFAGRMVNISITTWGGTFVLVTGDFGGAHSRFVIATQPLDDGTTLCEGIVYGPKGRGPLGRLFSPVDLRVRRFFTYGYLKDETRRLRGTQYRPHSLGPNDRDMIEFFQWVVSLPQDAPAAPATAPRQLITFPA